ncbi:MAG: flagellar assembly protein FliH [Pseudomonadota bacterium]
MSKVIPSEALSEYQKWSLPEVSSVKGNSSGDGPPRFMRANQIEKIQQQAYEEAYARGYKEGLASGQEKLKAQTQRLSQVIAKLTKPLADLDEVVEKELLAFILTICRFVIRREVSINPGEIVAVVKEALVVLPVSCRNIKVFLHPEDATLIRKLMPQEGEERTWKVVEEPTMVKGDCRVVSDTSQIDATLEKRIGAIAATLLGGDRESDG